MSETPIITLAQEIVQGRRLHRGENLNRFLTEELDELCAAANSIRQALCGNQIDLCTIINGKSGRCSENCKFCAQSAYNHTGCEEYPFLDADTIVKDAKRNEAQGVHRYSIVTAGRALSRGDMEKSLEAFRRLKKECGLSLCASHGFLSEEQFLALKEAGVTRYHENIETSRRYFPNICTSHTYDDKIASIRLAQSLGFDVCSGGIIGMGETWEDRMDMAVSLAELGIRSIPINALTPIPGTPFEHLPPLTPEEILRTVAIFRFLNPESQIRLAAGRVLLGSGGERAFLSGANATITGDMLTTTGCGIQDDFRMFSRLGLLAQPIKKS